MKNFLLTCFLALPCLFGSTTELRKVAQSPPEPPLHRSAVPVSPHSGDTHRGEETLSDTFTQVDYGTEVSSPANYTTSLTTLDGGPTLRASDIRHRTSLPSTVFRLPSLTNFGLVDPDQDMGAGEGIADSQPAPVTVSGITANSGREGNLQHTEAQSLVSSVLLLESNVFSAEPSPSMDLKSNKPAPTDKNLDPVTVSQGPQSFVPAGLTAYIYGEVILDPASSLDTAKLTTWPHFLSVKHDTPPPVKLQCPLVKGNLFEGSFGKQVFEFSLDLTDTVQPFSIALQTNLILDQYLIEAGDSIKLQINLRKGKILFGGPTGPKYQAQHFIRSALESSQWDQPPAMITSTSAKNQMIQTHSEMYQKAEKRASSVRNSLSFIENKEDSLNWLKMLAQADFERHPAWQLLESQSSALGKRMGTILASEIAGRQVMPFYRFMHSFSTLDEKAFPLIQNPEQFLQSVKNRFGWSHRSPELVAAFLSRSNVLAYHHKNGLFDQFDFHPPLLRDRLYGKFLVENVQKYIIEAKSFDRAIATVQTPWIQVLIGEMKSHLVKGADLSSYSFLSPEYTEVRLSEFDGKLVLMNFWISGCKYCLEEFQNVIHPAEQFFQDDPRVVFLSVSADGDTQLWEKTLSQGKFTSELSQPVYAGNKHEALLNLGISAYPKKILLGTAGQLLSFQDIPTNSEQLIRLIQKNLEPIPNL